MTEYSSIDASGIGSNGMKRLYKEDCKDSKENKEVKQEVEVVEVEVEGLEVEGEVVEGEERDKLSLVNILPLRRAMGTTPYDLKYSNCKPGQSIQKLVLVLYWYNNQYLEGMDRYMYWIKD